MVPFIHIYIITGGASVPHLDALLGRYIQVYFAGAPYARGGKRRDGVSGGLPTAVWDIKLLWKLGEFLIIQQSCV